MSKLYLGTSGLAFPVKNKLEYPPEFAEKSRLHYYATLTNSLEINSSFYRIPMPKTVAKWAEDTPQNFKFTFKLWREFTHNKGFVYNPDDVNRFMDSIDQAAEKKGSLLVQFPPSLKSDKMLKVRDLLEQIIDYDSDRTWHIAAEFRNTTWYNEDIYELLEGLGVGLVIHDKHKNYLNFFDQQIHFRYLRFHGPNGNYKGSYSDDVLMEYSEQVREWLSEGKTVYVYFNNTAGDAFGNMETLREMVEGNGEW